MSSTNQKPLSAFVSFPSPYTQSLLVQALVSTLPALSLSLVQFPEDQPPALQWADYDLMSFDIPHKSPSKYLISSYIYRKALTRKHQLHNTIIAYLAKCSHRKIPSILSPLPEGPVGNGDGTDVLGGGAPKGWIVDLQFADELDEALMDDLYELEAGMRENEGKEEGERRWWILKPGFADRAQGIRMFSTEEELRAIFEEFEPSSSDEEDDDEDKEEEDDEQESEEARQMAKGGVDGMIDMLAKKAVELGFSGEDDQDSNEKEDEDGEGGTGVMTSQLRHFVIQEYIPKPILFDIFNIPEEPSSSLEGYKFHLRAYVLITGAYTVHLARTMLALFSGSPYTPPKPTEDGQLDLRPHLTNTCLQTDAYGAPTPPEELVKLFWELEGISALNCSSSPSSDGKYSYIPRGEVTKEWLDKTFAKVGDVVAETVKAGAECGSFGLQFMPNAFEIFGVDLILSFPPSSSKSTSLPIPTVTLLEFNASPDFHQSGDRLRSELLHMFKGVIRLSVAPFFGLETAEDDEKNEEEMQLGEDRWGWRLVGKGEVRGSEW
ncbi:cytoplasm protein, putative [Cryptococcus deneoformans JEC21]|uniref:Cytoplasm protein, putative n=1 Tax=Cryptococcus deneoformans (strain JEC21 / ATCC MYA-565) TaxID=214684 RepID=Q5K8C7_CRYD1|nr:cytoplasm protein, putative [Cryptococcus neoformans var. neoformans JEC21]AAW46627.1 cytoplasm protein, putative [Cryptococcus neoformans var. neoformans JEC21]